jgi:glycosyltransferase 2 family protein
VRDKLVSILKIVISLGLIVLAFTLVDIRAVGAQLRQARLAFVAAAVALYVVAIIINGLKWNVLLRAQGIFIPFRALLRFLFTGFFFNNFLPANVGGDVMRGYGLARYTDRTADAAVSVIVDRVIGLVAYMSTAVIAAVVAVNFTGHEELQQVEWIAILALAALILGFGVLLSRRLRSVIDRVFQWRFLAPLGPIWGRVSDAFNAYRFRYDALVMAYGIALLGILSTTFVNWLVSQSMGGLMPLPIIFLFNPLIALVMTLPISIGGIGVSQTAYPFFFGLAGVPAPHATAVSIVMQGIQLVGSLPGGVLWLTGRRKKAPEPKVQVN